MVNALKFRKSRFELSNWGKIDGSAELLGAAAGALSTWQWAGDTKP
ncbi:hypothetical protein GA0061100_12624 [Rhizobium hainanense]|uniref:Uncharacterized protein n=1 Tax=Rhizobium hainanense TaxID=52131 RepID=A0A1C3WKY2_9HYPH|nr:hypothetical protein GA0061100_12624 [Rhizobium hainanense]